jgi:hypothetical protein
MSQFSPDATPEFDTWFGNELQELGRETAAALGTNLEALLLGGGYGRGEGGLVTLAGRQHPYNDLDLTIVVKNTDGVPALLHPVSERFAERLGIEVDFSRPLTESQIRQWPHTLMWHELALGYMVLSGPQDYLKNLAPDYIWTLPDLQEGARLLLNRGAGLLWALRVSEKLETSPDPDFVRRNLYKAQIAMGDVALMAAGCYEVQYSKRTAAFAKLSSHYKDWPMDLATYEKALRFKFRPDQVPADPPSGAELLEACRMWNATLFQFDGQRFGRSYDSARNYSSDTRPRENWPTTLWERLKNLIRNYRVGKFSWMHPRQALYLSLPNLLYPNPSPKRGIPERVPSWDYQSRRWLAAWRLYN